MVETKNAVRIPVKDRKTLRELFKNKKHQTVRLVAPNGKAITHLRERVYAYACVDGCQVRPNGTLEPEYAGGSEVDWNSQSPARNKGERIWIDAGGNAWPESELFIVVEDAS